MTFFQKKHRRNNTNLRESNRQSFYIPLDINQRVVFIQPQASKKASKIQHYKLVPVDLPQLKIREKKKFEVIMDNIQQKLKTTIGRGSLQFQLKDDAKENISFTIEDKNSFYESTLNIESNQKITLIQSKEVLSIASKIKTYYIGEIAKGIAGINERALDHIKYSMKLFKNCQGIVKPTSQEIFEKKVNLNKRLCDIGKKSLMLDLDQTLFHCSEERKDFVSIEVDIELYENQKTRCYLSLRPYAISFLKNISKYYEVIAFTASQQVYADALLEEIDPQCELIPHRLYRNDCIKVDESVYAKDLRIINRPLKDMVIVDNCPFSYIYQPENAIPILPYETGQDQELIKLEKYLINALKYNDLRDYNRQILKLEQYHEFDDEEQLVKCLFLQNSYY